MARFEYGDEVDANGLERRNATRLAQLDGTLDPGVLEPGRDLDAYFDHHGGKPAPEGWAIVEPIPVEVPEARKAQLDELLAQGDVDTIAYDAALAAAFGPARNAGLRYARSHEDAAAPRIWSEARKGLGAEVGRLQAEGHAVTDIAGHPIHHLVFTKADHPQHVLNPEMLVRCPPGALPGIGSGESAHEQFHEIYGVGDDNKRKMAWGDIGDPGTQQIMRDQAFRNPNDQVALGEVTEALRQANEEYGDKLGYLAQSFERSVVLDTETTGLSPAKGDRIVEIGAVELLDGVASGRAFHTYLDPERAIPIGASRIHGITDETVTGQPAFAEIADELVEFVGDSEVIAHNASFDRRFLDAELERAGLPPIEAERVVDSLALARKLHPGESNTLDALCERHGAHNRREGEHGALTDARTLADLYPKLVADKDA